ncbi:MAG: CDP-glucose 4,6-dehydratase [Pseudomonadota bacterium]
MFNNVYKNRRVFVTGHTGFKGSWLTQWLLNLGADIAGYSVDIPSQPSLYELLHLKEKIRQDYRDDIRDIDRLSQAMADFQPEIVFHLAAQPIVRTSLAEPKLTFDVNLGGTVNILDAIRHIDSIVAAVFITSDKCYENVEWEYGYRETDVLGGKDPYSASKACAEMAISAYERSFYQDSNQALVSARAGNVIGGGDWAKDRIVPDCMRAWAKGETVEVRRPTAIRPWQHVLDPLGGYLDLGARLYAKDKDVIGEAFNFGPLSETYLTVGELVKRLSNVWGESAHSKLFNCEMQSREAGLLKLCCDKALARLNWSATLSFSEAIMFTGEWYRDYYRSSKESMVDMTNAQIEKYVHLAKERGRFWAQ